MKTQPRVLTIFGKMESADIQKMGSTLRNLDPDKVYLAYATNQEQAIRAISGRTFDILLYIQSKLDEEAVECILNIKARQSASAVVVITKEITSDHEKLLRRCRPIQCLDFASITSAQLYLTFRSASLVFSEMLRQNKSTQDSLRSSQNEQFHLKRLLEDCPDGIIVVNAATEFIFSNHTAIKMLNIENAADKYFGFSLPRSLGTFQIEVRTGRQPAVIECHAKACDWHGQRATLVILRDITHHRELQARYQIAKESALESAKMKSTFLAKVSHEVRTPLNGILGMVQLLKQTELDAVQQDFVDTVTHSGEMLIRVINDVLDLSKIESQSFNFLTAECSLREIVSETIDLVGKAAYDKDLILASFIESGVPEKVRGDRHRIKQLLCNMLGNAIKYTEMGHVFLRVGMQNGKGPYKSNVGFDVIDTGSGIPRDKLNRIFEPFYQAGEYRGDSTGLGLAISQKLVELMGGDIRVDSAPGHGSRFHFNLVFDDIDTSPIEPKLTRNPCAIFSENALTSTILTEQLENLGFEVEERCGFESIAKRALDSELRPVVILDASPSSSGTMPDPKFLAEQVENLSFPIVIVCDRLNIGRYQDHFKGRVVAFFSPPFNQDKLNVCIEGAVNGKESGRIIDTTALVKDGFAGSHVLVAEDNLVNRKVLCGYLSLLGVEFDIAENGEQAVAKAKNTTYDMILMDSEMPILDGKQATRQIRSFERSKTRVPIVAVTAHAQSDEKDQCLTAGMDDYLTKPVMIFDLRAILQKYLAKLEPVNKGQENRLQTEELFRYFNPVVIASLKEVEEQEGDDTFIRTLFDHYFSEAAASLKTILYADKEDIAALKAAIHKLKGSSLSLGLDRVGTHLVDMERVLSKTPVSWRDFDQLASRLQVAYDNSKQLFLTTDLLFDAPRTIMH